MQSEIKLVLSQALIPKARGPNHSRSGQNSGLSHPPYVYLEFAKSMQGTFSTHFLSEPVKSFSRFLTTIPINSNSNVCRQLEKRRV
jgi:hypothetical protein